MTSNPGKAHRLLARTGERFAHGKSADLLQAKKQAKEGVAKPGKSRRKKRAARRRVLAREKAAEAASGGMLATQFFGWEGLIKIDDVAQTFGMSKGQLAETLGVKPETLQRIARAFAPKTQTRLREMLEIIGRVTEWAGGKDQAMAWYRAEPIPAFGGRTAEFLVKDGKAGAVRDYLDHVALGGFA
jgi:ribosome-binding protein aMBF1 (putative translation factor)